jgi:hypothetical protein
MNYDTDGAELFRGALKAHLAECETALAALPAGAAGLRLRKVKALDSLLASGGPIGSVAAAVLGEEVRPVRAILFNKTPQTNWALAWHQDRTICVWEQRETPGFGPWTIKSGMHHVAPPFGLLARMVTLRAHLDDVPASNAPLLVAPGSHKFGRVTERDINEVVRQCGTRACLAKAGDVWLYATPILHASDAAASPARRRVLQVDYAAEALPYGLEWLGV